jgi:hypothetical protein
LAITHSALTSGTNATNLDSYATASITPTSNRLVLAAIAVTDTTTPLQPTLTGCGLTWVEVATVAFNTIASPTYRVSVYRAMGASPSSGAVTIDLAGNVHTTCAWSIVEFDGVDTTGTNGSGAVVQSATNSEDNDADQAISVTLSAFGAADNRPYFTGLANRFSAVNWTKESGYTDLHQVAVGAENLSLFTAWHDSATDTSPSATVGVANLELGAIALEIKAAAGGTTEYTITPSGGVAFSGSAPLLKGRVFITAGGVTFAGEATYETHNSSRTITPSGGVVLSGTADVIFDGNGDFVITPSGGVVFGGSAPLVRGKILTAGGTITFSGTAGLVTHSAERIIEPDGGIVFSGHANVIYTAFGVEIARSKGMMMMHLGYMKHRRYRNKPDTKGYL